MQNKPNVEEVSSLTSEVSSGRGHASRHPASHFNTSNSPRRTPCGVTTSATHSAEQSQFAREPGVLLCETNPIRREAGVRNKANWGRGCSQRTRTGIQENALRRHYERDRFCETKPIGGGDAPSGAAQACRRTPCGVTTNGTCSAKQSQSGVRWVEIQGRILQNKANCGSIGSCTLATAWGHCWHAETAFRWAETRFTLRLEGLEPPTLSSVG